MSLAFAEHAAIEFLLCRSYMSDFFLATVMQFFLEIVVPLAYGGGYIGKSEVLLQKVQLVEFFAIFFPAIFSCCQCSTCTMVATCVTI